MVGSGRIVAPHSCRCTPLGPQECLLTCNQYIWVLWTTRLCKKERERETTHGEKERDAWRATARRTMLSSDSHLDLDSSLSTP